MDVTRKMEVVAIRAIELLSLIKMLRLDTGELSESKLKPLEDAIDDWNPSVADCDRIKARLGIQ